VSRPVAILCAVATALAAGCGGEIEVPSDQRVARQGAELFYERCSGCHSLEAANAYGSKPTGQLQGGERTNGPDFNVRKVDREDALFAIRNGGFSGAIMPANIVVGDEAEEVADFLARYSGDEGGTNDPTASGQTGQ
jgi:mono/diheme cytochrome c family protein